MLLCGEQRESDKICKLLCRFNTPLNYSQMLYLSCGKIKGRVLWVYRNSRETVFAFGGFKAFVKYVLTVSGNYIALIPLNILKVLHYGTSDNIAVVQKG